MKKFLSVVFAALLTVFLLPVLPVQHAGADTFDKSSVYEPYYILVNADTPTKSYRGIEQDADRQVYPASTTKILTCILALEKGNLDDMVTVSAKAVDFGNGNSLMGLEEGDQYSLRDLLYGLMLPSGNDAAIAIAEHIAGSTEAFANMMNEKAAELEMSHSHFVTVHGKQNENHYTTVRDMARLTAYALNESNQKTMFRTIVGTKTYTASTGPRAIELVNSNRMLVDMPATEKVPEPISCLYEGTIGVKTGDTNAAGKCLIAAAERDGVTLIAVLYGGTLNDPEYNSGWSDGRKDKYNARRFQDAAAMFDYAFNDMNRTVSFSELVRNGMPAEFDITIINAAADDSQNGVLKAKANLSLDTNISIMVPDPNMTYDKLPIEAQTNITSMYAPISEGSTVGTVSYIYHGKTLATVELTATRSVKEGNVVTDITPVYNVPDQTVPDAEQQTAESPQKESAMLISGGPDNTKGSSCSSGFPIGAVIAIIVLVVVLLVVIVLFILYVRAEKKRRAAAKRRAARRRAQQQAMQSDRYDRPTR
jgi:D-alanyl-D-alanine carboxypeptidase (penicillin-binding protein 5/6)